MIYVSIESPHARSKMVLGERSNKERIKALKTIQSLQERFQDARITAISGKLAKAQGRAKW